MAKLAVFVQAVYTCTQVKLSFGAGPQVSMFQEQVENVLYIEHSRLQGRTDEDQCCEAIPSRKDESLTWKNEHSKAI